MKIAFLTPEFTTEKNWHGGLANYLKRVTEGLTSKGHDVSVFVVSETDEKISEGETSVYRIKFNSLLYKTLNLITFKRIPVFLKTLISSSQVCKRFKKEDREKEYDVIQVSSYLTPGLFLFSSKDTERLVTRVSSITKVVWEAYGKNNRLDLLLVNWAENILLRKSKKKYSPSLISKRILSEQYNIDVDLLQPPYYFNQIEKDYSFFEKNLKGKKYFLFFGSLGRLKGVDFLAKNMYKILKSNREYSFVFVGKDMGYQGGSMIDYVREKAGKYSDRIIYSNSLEHAQLFPVIENANAVILPSRIDNLPNTLIESMSLGKIVVGTYDGGFDQLIDDGENGFLLKFGDDEALLGILRRITKLTPKERAEYERRTKNRVVEQLDFEERINDLEDYFKDIVNNKNA